MPNSDAAMNYIVGSAIKLISEPSVTVGSTAIVKSVIDPNGIVVLSNQAMTLEVLPNGNNGFAFTFQSVLGTHPTGTCPSPTIRNFLDAEY